MKNRYSVLIVGLVCTAVGGCTTQPAPQLERWLSLDEPVAREDQAADTLREERVRETRGDTEPEIIRRTVPSIVSERADGIAGVDDRPNLPSGPINVTLPPQPLPTFVNTVFGEILEQPFLLGPRVAEREEMISLRTVRDMEPETFLSLVEEALKDYGLGIRYEDGLFRILELSELRAQMPRFITARARPAVPTDLRPVVQFVELSAIDAADMQSILEQAFPDRAELTIRNNRRANSLVISGLADDVNAAMAIVEEMDELRYAGTQVITFAPENWEASSLAAALNDILTLEGFMVGVGATMPRAITMLPLDFTNQLMIFAADRSLADHALSVALRLDHEARRSEVRGAHVYQVQNAEAAVLAEVVGAVMGGQPGGARGAPPEGASSGPQDGRSIQFQDLTVDEQGNRIVYYGTRADYDEILYLLRELDTPIPEVLIEVTIAEVTLTDDSSYGLDLVFDSEVAPRFAAQLRSSDGFSAVVDSGEVSLDARANASNNQINVLSTPRIVTRSGAEASVQVGTDVPLITSQAASGVETGGRTEFLQTVEYRSTGILLSVEPRVYSGNRIDLTINQEVSAAQANDNQGISSPLISNRSLSSQLSLQDGQTAVLGGLIENRFNRGNSGVPFFKDVPVLGAAFRSETLSATRTMLVVLVTPYILDTRSDRQQVVDALVGSVNRNFSNQQGRSRTLIPPGEPMQIRPARRFEAEPLPVEP